MLSFNMENRRRVVLLGHSYIRRLGEFMERQSAYENLQLLEASVTYYGVGGARLASRNPRKCMWMAVDLTCCCRAARRRERLRNDVTKRSCNRDVRAGTDTGPPLPRQDCRDAGPRDVSGARNELEPPGHSLVFCVSASGMVTGEYATGIRSERYQHHDSRCLQGTECISVIEDTLSTGSVMRMMMNE